MEFFVRPCKILCILIPSILFIAHNAYAKTASQVFEAVSSSIVIILALDANGDTKGLGSGVVLSEGVVATNYHVIQEAKKVKVVHQGNEYPATLEQYDWDKDVCTLSVSGFKAPAVVIGDTNNLKIGAQVYAIGAPQGFDLSLTEGIVSSLRKVEGGHYIQTTAAISPGSSGGGLFDEQGHLLGLTSFYITESQNLNFAVPIEWIEDLPKRNIPEAKKTEASLYWINKALLLEKNEDWPALVDHSLCWTKAKPEDAVSWFSLGFAYNKTGQVDNAIEAFSQALSFDSNYTLAWCNLGIMYGLSKQSKKAINAFSQALLIDPKDANAWFCLGAAYMQSGTFEKAIDAYRDGLRINPDDIHGWYYLGEAFTKTKQKVKAIEAYKQALIINPEYAEAWYRLGHAFALSGQANKAIDAFLQSLRINPDDTEALYYLGLAYSLSGQKGQAMDVYKHLKNLNPEKANEFFEKAILP